MNAVQYPQPRAVSSLRRAVRWQVIPTTLSIALGTILFVINCVHLNDAMIPEIARAFDPNSGFTIGHGIMCIIASTLFFGAAVCAFLAARYWIRCDHGTAILFNISTPLLIVIGAFLAYLQV
jgi:hypothetical protein